MPFPTLPPAPTPDQIVKFVTDAGEAIFTAIASSASSSEKALSEGVKAAISQLTVISNDARQNLQKTQEQAQRDVLALLGQLRRLGGNLQDDIALGTVNGEPFFEPIGCLILVAKAVNSGSTSIVFETREPTAVSAFQTFASSTTDELRAKAREKLVQHVPNVGSVPFHGAIGVDDVTMALAIATIILAVGASIFVVCVGLALLYAISRNYDINDVSFEWTGGGPKLHIGAIKR